MRRGLRHQFDKHQQGPLRVRNGGIGQFTGLQSYSDFRVAILQLQEGRVRNGSIHTLIEGRNVRRNHLFHTAIQVPIGEMNPVRE